MRKITINICKYIMGQTVLEKLIPSKKIFTLKIIVAACSDYLVKIS